MTATFMCPALSLCFLTMRHSLWCDSHEMQQACAELYLIFSILTLVNSAPHSQVLQRQCSRLKVEYKGKQKGKNTHGTPRKPAPGTGQADTKGLKVKWKSSLKE